jgi:hypothetical protein
LSVVNDLAYDGSFAGSLEECTYIRHAYFDLTGAVRKSWYHQAYGKR